MQERKYASRYARVVFHYGPMALGTTYITPL